ncbi:hypothetical protein MACK_002202 [Theileria orientalis]|uniref:Uncharacterized protein n=1 Tax=Theileria orientalis TaxID=68886 RepID=A0A976MBT1_THEOR|nr:hypothetical protein MACK_002202 [Theileria orientalis]
MTRSDFKKESRAKKEELKYPCSPRSQKWISNLLPVLESYNYNYMDIIKLVKGCDYNADKIQIEVERIMQMKLGHEQGEWELVKPNTKSEKNPSKSQSSGSNSFSNSSKFKQKTYNKEDRPKRTMKVSPNTRVETKPEKPESEDEKKELFTSWASLLKRDPMSTSSNLSSSNMTSKLGTNLPSTTPQSTGVTSSITQPVDKLSSLAGKTGLNEKPRLGEQPLPQEQRPQERPERPKERPAVIMPKEFDFNESRFTFGCLEEELWTKPWPEWRPFQKPRSNRMAERSQNEVFPNYYDRKAFYFDDPKKFDRFHVSNSGSNMQPVNNNANMAPVSTNTNMGPVSGNNNNLSSGNLGNSNMGPNTLGAGNMSGKDGVYFTYPYSNDRLQNPPGLVSYYTPQPFYPFGNNNNVTSMWQN